MWIAATWVSLWKQAFSRMGNELITEAHQPPNRFKILDCLGNDTIENGAHIVHAESDVLPSDLVDEECQFRSADLTLIAIGYYSIVG